MTIRHVIDTKYSKIMWNIYVLQSPVQKILDTSHHQKGLANGHVQYSYHFEFCTKSQKGLAKYSKRSCNIVICLDKTITAPLPSGPDYVSLDLSFGPDSKLSLVLCIGSLHMLQWRNACSRNPGFWYPQYHLIFNPFFS